MRPLSTGSGQHFCESGLRPCIQTSPSYSDTLSCSVATPQSQLSNSYAALALDGTDTESNPSTPAQPVEVDQTAKREREERARYIARYCAVLWYFCMYKAGAPQAIGRKRAEATIKATRLSGSNEVALDLD